MPSGGVITAMAIAAGAQIVGGVVGNAMASGDRDAAKQAASDAYGMLANMGLPPDLSKKIILKEFQSAGELSPEMLQDINYGVSKAAQTEVNPELKKAQFNALHQLQARGKVGLTPEDRAALSESLSQSAQQTQGATQAILQNAQARGQGGSGNALANQLIASQQGGNRAAQQGLDIGARASQNALQAMLQSGNLAGQMDQSEFNQAMQKNTSADQFSRLNTDAQINRQAANVNAKNRAMESNLASKQRLMDVNTDQFNKELYRQNQAKRDFWNDQMARTQAIANAKLGQSSNLRASGDATAGMWSGIGQGVGQIGGALATSSKSSKPTPKGQNNTQQVVNDIRSMDQDTSNYHSGLNRDPFSVA